MERGRSLHFIPDDELLRRLAELIQQSRRVEADLVAHIGEVDARRLYAREAAPSMFVYCTRVLHLSEAEAYLRITVARASREHPMLLTLLGDGRLHLTGIARLAPYLTGENRDRLLKRATHKSRREIEELIAEIAPRPDAPAVMRKLPEGRGWGQALPSGRAVPFSLQPDGSVASPDASAASEAQPAELCLDRVGVTSPAPVQLVAATLQLGVAQLPAAVRSLSPPVVQSRSPAFVQSLSPAVVQPLSPARYKVQFTASAQLHDKLVRIQALMRSQVPDGDLAAIIEQAVTAKLERLEARRFAQTRTPRKGLSATDASPSSRHIPAAVRRAVHERDEGRCRYLDKQGRRCPERGRLEFHHRHPFALGGDRRLENISLLCHAHNQYLGDHDYGGETMARHRRSGAGSRTASRPPPRSRQAQARTPAPLRPS